MSNLINIVCSHEYNKLLKSIEKYQVDLGKSYTKKDPYKNTITSDIKDKFVITFLRENDSYIYKVGVLGKISIYTCSNLLSNEVVIYKDDKKYFRNVDLELAQFNIEKNLAELLWSLDKTENQ